MTNLHDALTSYINNGLANIPPSGGAASIRDDFQRGYCSAAELIIRELETILAQHNPPESNNALYRVKEVIKRLIDCNEYSMTEIDFLDEIRKVEKF